jgi:uncharacterized protein with GYD domain
MATYIVLTSFTDKGAKAVRDTVKRADAIRKMGKKAGVTAGLISRPPVDAPAQACEAFCA